MPIQRVKEAIEEIKKGNMVIMIDDEDRENEGDLVYAATFSSPQKVNFMASCAKGLICTPMSKEIAKRLELLPMVQNNDAQYETAFTVSVDDRCASTGISSKERDMTINRLADPMSVPSDLLRPGHIFPLIAKDGGVLVRTGHTEGSVDLCALSGVSPVSVICEIINEDGEMARRDDLKKFAKTHNLKIVYIADIVEYRLQQELLIKQIKQSQDFILGYEAKKILFKDHEDNIHTVYIFKELSNMSYVKFHNISNDLLMLQNKEKFDNMINSINYLSKNGGVLIFLNQNMHNKQESMKSFGIGAQILKFLKIDKVKLLTSNDNHCDFISLNGFNIDVVEQVHIKQPQK